MFESLVARSRAAVRDGCPCVMLPEREFAAAATQRLIRPDDPGGWLTTIVGPRGSGKSTLVAQVLREASKRRPQLAFVIQSAEEWVQFLQTRAIPPNTSWPGMIVVEDPDRTLGDLDDANLLAHWFDDLHRSGVRVLVTLSEQPGQAEALSPRFVSRLHAGLTARMTSLSPESRQQFVRALCRSRELKLADRVVEWIAAQPPGTCRSVSKLLDRLTRDLPPSAVVETLDALPIELAGDATTGRPALALIATEVAMEFGIPLSELRSESRDQALQLPRRCAMWLAHEVRWPMAQIGRYFGRRTHASVSYSCRELIRQFDDVPTLRDRLLRLQTRLVENPREDCG
jgi:chromosomal replication initiation ATPase DnaA